VSVLEPIAVSFCAYSCSCSFESSVARTGERIDAFIADRSNVAAEDARKPYSEPNQVCLRLVPPVMELDTIAKNASKDLSARIFLQQSTTYLGVEPCGGVRSYVGRNHEDARQTVLVVDFRQVDSGGPLLATRTEDPTHFS
jgi:hypothetical protein